MIMHVALDVPAAGRYPIEFKLFHGDLQATVRMWFVVTVPNEGNAFVTPLDPDKLPVAR